MSILDSSLQLTATGALTLINYLPKEIKRKLRDIMEDLKASRHRCKKINKVRPMLWKIKYLKVQITFPKTTSNTKTLFLK